MLVLALEFSRNSATRSGCPVISTVHAGAQDERLRAHPGHRRSADPSREWLDGAGTGRTRGASSGGHLRSFIG